jgi:oligopeptidase B
MQTAPDRVLTAAHTLRTWLFLAALSALLAAPGRAQEGGRVDVTKPPVARQTPKVDTIHGDTRIDNYFWLRDNERTNPEVIAYLEAENAYTAHVMKPTEELQNRIFEEIKARVKETDLTVPYRKWDYYYYSRTEEGRQYPIYCRKKGSPEAPEEIYFDQNREAEGHEFYKIGALEVSVDGTKLAYSVDMNGSEVYTMTIRDLATGEMRADRLEKVVSAEWSNDGRYLFYTVQDEAKRAYQLFRHKLGSDPAEDQKIFEEPDALYSVFLYRTRNDQFILFGSESSTTNETHFIPAGEPLAMARVIQPREADHEYHVDHRGDRFYIRTNLDARNFRLVSAPVSSPGKANWQELLPHRPSVRIDDFDVFSGHWVSYEREQGLRKIRITDFANGKSHHIEFPDKAYSVSPTGNGTFDTKLLRFSYQSLTTPSSVYDYDMTTRDRTLLKRVEVLGEFDPSSYVTERIFARAFDGAEIPIAIVYRKGVRLDGSAPLLLYGYGSYGINSDATFSHARLSLIDRGVIYAIANIRGGAEMGEEWHDQGKMMSKRNSFTDFIAAAEHLIAKKYTSEERLAINGGSAGGLLMGAVVNMRPDLFKAVVADVPFVDVMNTMLDPTLPLTVGEYLEWGNPSEAPAYFYMKTYCPYTNVSAQRYPNMLVTAGLNDPRVSYWEAAKWVAKLRAAKLDDNVLILRTNMGAGHAGASGRYDAWKETAFRYAFILTQLGVEGRSQ